MRAWTVEEVEALASGPRAAAWSGAVEALGIEDTEIYRAATEVLRSLEPLNELDEAFERAPLVALRVVAALDDTTQIASVAALLSHPSGGIRAAAAETLGLLGTADLLHPATRDPVAAVRAAAFRGIGASGDEDALRSLQQLAHSERDVEARTALVDVLHPRGLWP